MKYEITINGARRSAEFTPPKNKGLRVAFTVDGRPMEADAVRLRPHPYEFFLYYDV